MFAALVRAIPVRFNVSTVGLSLFLSAPPQLRDRSRDLSTNQQLKLFPCGLLLPSVTSDISSLDTQPQTTANTPTISQNTHTIKYSGVAVTSSIPPLHAQHVFPLCCAAVSPRPSVTDSCAAATVLCLLSSTDHTGPPRHSSSPMHGTCPMAPPQATPFPEAGAMDRRHGLGLHPRATPHSSRVPSRVAMC